MATRTPADIAVPLLDLTAQYQPIRTEILDAIARVCDSQRFILGPEVDALERELATVLECEHAITVSSGTDALLVALMALGVGPGAEVITPTYSFFATAGCVSRLGATPVFVDIDPVTFNVTAAAIAAAISPRTRAILPVHLYGCPPTWSRSSSWRDVTTSRSSRTPRRRSAPGIRAASPARSARSAASRFFRRRISARSATAGW
jgi:dTDP-4-amino-4,6-dideoxygalactose transaminase